MAERPQADQSLLFSPVHLKDLHIRIVTPEDFDTERLTVGGFLRGTELLSAISYYDNHPDKPLSMPSGAPIIEPGPGQGISSAALAAIHDGSIYAVDNGSVFKAKEQSHYKKLQEGEDHRRKEWGPISEVGRIISKTDTERVVYFESDINRFMDHINSPQFPQQPNLGGIVMTSPPEKGFNDKHIQRKMENTLRLLDNFFQSLQTGGKIIILGDGNSEIEHLLIQMFYLFDGQEENSDFSIQIYNAPRKVGKKNPQPGYDYPPMGSRFAQMIRKLSAGRLDLQEVHEDAKKHGVKAFAYERLTVLTKK